MRRRVHGCPRGPAPKGRAGGGFACGQAGIHHKETAPAPAARGNRRAAMQKPLTNLARRRLLAGSAGALAAAGMGATGLARGSSATPAAPSAAPSAAPAAKPLPPYAAWKDPDSVIVHSANTIETRRSAFGDGVITPSRELYVRNNLPPPDESVLDDR